MDVQYHYRSELKAHKIDEVYSENLGKVNEKIDPPDKKTWKCCGHNYKHEHAYAKHMKHVHE